jgi:hypothetical protein
MEMLSTRRLWAKSGTAVLLSYHGPDAQEDHGVA